MSAFDPKRTLAGQFCCAAQQPTQSAKMLRQPGKSIAASLRYRQKRMTQRLRFPAQI
jgi:hypothetical protein